MNLLEIFNTNDNGFFKVISKNELTKVEKETFISTANK